MPVVRGAAPGCSLLTRCLSVTRLMSKLHRKQRSLSDREGRRKILFPPGRWMIFSSTSQPVLHPGFVPKT